jgi:AcrR family transcriptional regulator
MKDAATVTAQTSRILEAASELIVHYGFDKTTMEDIARKVGMSKSALYLTWASKDQLLAALLAYQMRRLLQDFGARLEDDPEGGHIANMYRHALLALKNNPLMAALYTRDSRVLGDFVHHQDISRYTNRIMISIASTAQMQTAGLLQRGIRPEVMAYVFSIIALGFIHIQSIVPTSEAPPLEEVAEAVSYLMQHGFAGSSGDSAAGKQAIMNIVDFAIRQYDDELAKAKR